MIWIRVANPYHFRAESYWNRTIIIYKSDSGGYIPEPQSDNSHKEKTEPACGKRCFVQTRCFGRHYAQ